MKNDLVYRFWLCEACDGSFAAVYLYHTGICWHAVAPQFITAESASAPLAVAYAVDRWIRAGRKPHSQINQMIPGRALPSGLIQATPEQIKSFDTNNLIKRLVSNVVNSAGLRVKPG